MACLNIYSGHVRERIRAGDATGSGVKIQFKSPGGKNSSYENPLDKNVSHLINCHFFGCGDNSVIEHSYI